MDRAFAAVVAAFRHPARPAGGAAGGPRLGCGRADATRTWPSSKPMPRAWPSAVGAMMTLLMGVRDTDAIARACDLGLGMQLTNIARDIGEDAREGRLFLPLSWLREEGIAAEDFLAAPRFTPAIGRLTARLLAAADRALCARRSRHRAAAARLPRGHRRGARDLCRDRARGGAQRARFRHAAARWCRAGARRCCWRARRARWWAGATARRRRPARRQPTWSTRWRPHRARAA